MRTDQNFHLNPNNDTRFSDVLHPWFVTGFTDAEGSFSVGISRNKEIKVGWVVKLSFQITLHQKDKCLLEQIKTYLGVGSIYRQGKDIIQFQVSSKKDIKVIIDHLDKYPLITQKLADYILFKQAFELVLRQEHVTPEGLQKIVAIKASMNRGLSDELKTAFPNIITVARPLVVGATATEIKDPNWLAGFVDGDGCFFINIMNSASHSLGFLVNLVFKITQHSRDEQLMRSLVDYLDCGKVFVRSNNTAVDFKITKFLDLYDKVIPFFQKYPLHGVKNKDFVDLCKVAELMKNKAHLTEEGLDQIRKIKAGMNKGRQSGDGL